MKTLLSLFLIAIASSAFAQTEQKLIIEQVWKPYISATNDLNTDAFMNLHSKDVVRASSDNGSVMGFAEYAAVRASGDQNFKVNKWQKKLELRFSEQWVNQNLAYEVGMYKSTMVRPSGSTTITYGKFQVILKKENGTWKVLSETDSSEGGTLTDKDFLYARPMEI